MRHVFFIILLLAGISFDAGASVPESFRVECESKLPASVYTVRTEQSRVNYDFTKSIREISAMRSYHTGGLTLGLTKVELRSEVKWRFESLTDRSGLTCLRPSADFFVTVNPQTVYIAKEFPQGTCAFNEIAAHELRHVYANQEHTEEVAQWYRQEIARVFGQTVLYGDKEELRKEMKDVFEHQWAKAISKDLQNVRLIHERIDTPEEYARNNTMCAGEVPLILRALKLRK